MSKRASNQDIFPFYLFPVYVNLLGPTLNQKSLHVFVLSLCISLKELSESLSKKLGKNPLFGSGCYIPRQDSYLFLYRH